MPDSAYTLIPPIPAGEREFPPTPEPLEPGVFSDGSTATAEWPVLADALEEIQQQEPREHKRPRVYIPLTVKLVLVSVCSISWAAFSAWLAIPWIGDLAASITLPLAIAVIGGLAIVPGYLNAHLIASLLFDRPPPLRFDLDYPEITVIIACYNEEESVGETIEYVGRSDYPGPMRIMVADDGSTDRTVEIAEELAKKDDRVRVRNFPHRGKSQTLNAAVRTTATPLIATVDADTLLMPQSLKRIVSRLLVSPPRTVAAAGAMFVRNSRDNLLTKAQEWDYFLGIASIKRQQGLLQGTMVAQGAFSVYRTESLRKIGGWPNRIGEDIVLTWALMRRGGGVTYEKTAVAFTDVPSTPRAFAKQRRRWARGMIEGLRDYGPALIKARRSHSHSVFVNYAFPYVDLVYSVGFPVGIVLALGFGNYAIVGPLTLLVLPLNLVLSGFMYHLSRQTFKEVDLRVRNNLRGFFTYQLVYQLVMSPVSVWGYFQELFRAARKW
jgi:biofilm PGA synthesis N-glycosyltransferase PgaC